MDPDATPKQSALSAHVALFAVQIFFGTSTVLGKFALLAFPPNALVGFRIGGAALFFYVLQRFRGGLALDCRRDYLKFAGFAVIGISLNQLLFFQGLSMTTAVNTALLAVTIPIFTFILSAAFGHDNLTWRRVAGIVVAAVGVIYLIDPARAHFGSETTLGDLAIVANSLCYALYMAMAKKTIARYGALKSIAWLFIFASVINVPVGLYALRSVDVGAVGWQSWLFVLGLITFPTILAYFWNAWALSRATPSVVAVYIYLQPVFGFLGAVMFLGEHFSFRVLVSALLVFVGVFLVTRRRRAVNE